jgi:GR25 family glycosyltransferase involved in LPS biosynthesis
LVLTPELASLFKPNDFFWKKAVMGCALSHLKAWVMLLNEPPEISSYLILEDDARLQKGWREAWLKAKQSLPDDWDCVYLGGILPPNKQGFLQATESVGPGLARVALNSVFGQRVPTRYFHFCAYSYILSRRGARKIIESIEQKGGYWTSADHMICTPADVMNLYMVDPLIAGASQDDDPMYQNAEFNNFSRVDSFDSDLWNNDERFSLEEITKSLSTPVSIDLGSLFNTLDKPIQPCSILRFVSLDTCQLTNGLYETAWLHEIFQTKFTIEPVNLTDPLNGSEQIIVCLAKPKWHEQLMWLEMLRRNGKTFKIIHLSDEYGNDPIHMYSWPEVTGVVRFYTRHDLVNLDSKVLIIPLGYHWKYSGIPVERKLQWSFAGTNWFNRSRDMEPLNAIQPNLALFYKSWEDPEKLNESEYMDLVMKSKCVICPSGQNVETFRFYEALECGSVPVFIDSEETTKWLQSVFGDLHKIPFIRIKNWSHAAELLEGFSTNSKEFERYRSNIMQMWSNYKVVLKDTIQKWLKN